MAAREVYACRRHSERRLESEYRIGAGFTVDREVGSRLRPALGSGLISTTNPAGEGALYHSMLEMHTLDDDTWTVTRLTKPSFWGHRPPRHV